MLGGGGSLESVALTTKAPIRAAEMLRQGCGE